MNLPIIFSLIFTMLVGCARVPHRFTPAYSGARTLKAQKLEDSIREHKRTARVLKALAWVELSNAEEERKTQAAIVIERPSSLRIDAMDEVADVWAQAGTDGKKIWIFVPSKQKLYSENATSKNFYKFAKFDWEPSELVSVLAGFPSVSENMDLVEIEGSRGAHFFDRVSSTHIWTGKERNRVERCMRYGENEKLIYDIKFSDHHKFGTIEFPRHIEARFPIQDAAIRITYKDIKFGDEVDDGIFMPPKAGKR